MIPDRKGEKLMVKVRKRVKYDEDSTVKGRFNSMHDKSVYEVGYPYQIFDRPNSLLRYKLKT